MSLNIRWRHHDEFNAPPTSLQEDDGVGVEH